MKGTSSRISTFIGILLSAFFCGVVPAYAFNTWNTVTPSGASGTFRAVATAGEYVYLATTNALYGSADGGASWSTGTGLPATAINAVAIGWTYGDTGYEVNENTPVYTATDSGVYMSTLGSSAWTETTLTGAVYDVQIDQLLAVSGSPTTLYAGTSNGIHRSQDSGLTWIPVGLERMTVTDIVTDFNDFETGRIYARTSDGAIYGSDLFSTSNVDESWSVVYSGPSNDISLLNAIGGITWITTASGILKDDGTGSWVSTNIGMPNGSVYTVASDYNDSAIAYAVHASQGIYRTTTEALEDPEWLPFNINLPAQTMLDIVTNPVDSTVVYALRGNALYRLDLDPSNPTLDVVAPGDVDDLAVLETTDLVTGDIAVTLTWTRPSGDPENYVVRHATEPINDESAWDDATDVDGEPTPYGESDAERFVVEPLPAQTRIYFAVRARDAVNNTANISNVVYVGDNAPDADTTAPSTPTNLVVNNITSSGFTLSWNASTDAVGVAGYRVYRGVGSGSLVEIATVPSGTSYVHTGLSASTLYTLAVQAYDTAGNQSTQSSTVSATTQSAPSGGGGGSSGGGGGGGGGSSSRDTNAPRSTSVSINNGTASTNQRAVTLSLSARDESTPMTMQVSNTNNFTGVSWIPYKTSHPWTLTTGNGSKTVYVRFKDSKGNISSAVSDSITLNESSNVVVTSMLPQSPVQPTGAVQGATPFRFTIDLKLGMQHGDVAELQKRLRSEGLFTHPTNTGYFGPATMTAVQAYQRKHSIDPTGFVGPMTRAKLNGTTAREDNGISLADFVRLLIAVGVIPPEKAATALSVLENL